MPGLCLPILATSPEAWERRLGEERASEQWQREQRDVIEVPALTPRSTEILAQVEKMPLEKRSQFIAELGDRPSEGRAALDEAKRVGRSAYAAVR